ncbi:MAG: secondary thiamine-phosphate synthase enzyme YjbQ [Candidatus Pacearchaeota archaeon]
MRLSIKTTKKEDLIDITYLVQEELIKNEFSSGMIFLSVPHTTCALLLNEYEKDLKEDFLNFFRMLKENEKILCRHENSYSHIFSSIIGNQILIPFKEKKLILGKWQRIILCEFDGPRQRELNLTFIKLDD